jgi:hypothetical protein
MVLCLIKHNKKLYYLIIPNEETYTNPQQVDEPLSGLYPHIIWKTYLSGLYLFYDTEDLCAKPISLINS